MNEGEISMIDCKEAERRLHRYLDRELSSQEMAEVQSHLESCENCSAHFRFVGNHSFCSRNPQGSLISDLLQERFGNRIKQLTRMDRL